MRKTWNKLVKLKRCKSFGWMHQLFKKPQHHPLKTPTSPFLTPEIASTNISWKNWWFSPAHPSVEYQMRDKSEFEPVCRTRLPTNWIFHPQFAFPLHQYIFFSHNKIISVLKIFIFLRLRIFVHFPCKNIYFATLISWRGPGVAKRKCWITRPPFCPPCGLSHHITCLPGNCIKYKK